tara:strand:+ start:16909 stop:17145 length:237 start_codon:yes stop_codon:yes gene_type:complete
VIIEEEVAWEGFSSIDKEVEDDANEDDPMSAASDSDRLLDSPHSLVGSPDHSGPREPESRQTVCPPRPDASQSLNLKR